MAEYPRLVWRPHWGYEDRAIPEIWTRECSTSLYMEKGRPKRIETIKEVILTPTDLKLTFNELIERYPPPEGFTYEPSHRLQHGLLQSLQLNDHEGHDGLVPTL
jgi:hypothetical protein